MLLQILDDLLNNWQLIFLSFTTLIIILMALYIKMYARIYPPGTHYRHYRKGRIIREGNNGGMVIMIPFLDSVEVVEIDTSIIDPRDRFIVKERTVNSDIGTVWKTWTTEEGVKTFFAPEAKVELQINGPYEMYFDPTAVIGQRGGEGLRILSYLPEEMLSFEWNAPPTFPAERRLKTWVVVQFEEALAGHTKVRLIHCGWREGGKWQEVYNYFDRAWDIVMDNLQKRFDEGPITW